MGSNFPADPKLIKEETSFDVTDKSNSDNARHERWLQLMAEYKGKIDVAAGQKFLADHFDAFEKRLTPASARCVDTSIFRRAACRPGRSRTRPAERYNRR